MRLIFISLLLVLCCGTAEAADRYWVGGGSSANWNATGPTNWGTASNTQDNASVPGAADDVIFDGIGTGASNSTISATTTVNSLVMSGYANTLTFSSGELTIDGQNSGGDSLIFSSGMTYSTTTQRIYFTGSGTSKITTAGKAIGSVVFNNAGDTFQLQDDLYILGNGATNAAFSLSAGTFDPNGKTVFMSGSSSGIFINGSPTFYNLVRTGNATKTDGFYIGGNFTVTNTFTIEGNSSTNRVLLASNTLGTARTITLGASATFKTGSSNFDMRDITVTGGAAGETDLSAITGGSGDCGGNTGVTFTTADDWYWNGSGTRNLSDYTYWYTATNGGGTQMASTRPPLPQDTLYVDGNSIDGATTIDQDLPRMPGIDFTGTAATGFHMNNIAQTVFGSVVFTDDVTITPSPSYSLTFGGRAVHIFNPVSAALGQAISVAAPNGSVQLTNNMNTSTLSFNITHGTFDANDNNVQTSGFDSSNSTIRKILMGAGIWSVQLNWSLATTTNLDISGGFAETSTISWGNPTGTTARSFGGGGLTYNNLSVVANTSGTEIMSLTGSNTFNTLTINAPKTVKFTAGTTTNVNSFVVTGAATIASVTASSPYTINDLNGGVNVNDYLNVTDSIATPAATFYYGLNGTANAYSLANGWTQEYITDTCATDYTLCTTQEDCVTNYWYWYNSQCNERPQYPTVVGGAIINR